MKIEKGINQLIEKYIRSESNQQELEDALTLFEAPYQNLNLRRVIYEAWKVETGINKQPESENFSEVLDKIHHRINLENQVQRKSKGKRLLVTIPKVAAILIIGILLGLFIHQLENPEPLYSTFISPKGSVSQMILPDNTLVYLNAGSEIKYTVNSTNKQREVFLNGEAWFEVTKNKKKPFVVHTPFYDVKVFGTQFNVKAYQFDEEFTTTLEEGNIEVVSGKLKVKENTFLKPGEQLVYNTSENTLKIKNVNTRLFTSWKDNKIIFINMNLKELIVLLERKFGVDIEVADNMVLDYHYDGTIKEETILEVLDLLKETLPIQYKIEGQKIIIQNK